MSNNTILEFHIGRGGRFNNQGFLYFVGESKGIAHTSAYGNDVFPPCNDEGETIDEGECLNCNGNEVGLTMEEANSGIGRIDLDGDYDTTYTTYLEDISEKEIQAIIDAERSDLLTIMEKDELLKEEIRLMDLYYSTKRKTNRTTNQMKILNLWREAKSYWDKVIEIREKIKSVNSK
jgi:hypothetical protein